MKHFKNKDMEMMIFNGEEGIGMSNLSYQFLKNIKETKKR